MQEATITTKRREVRRLGAAIVSQLESPDIASIGLLINECANRRQIIRMSEEQVEQARSVIADYERMVAGFSASVRALAMLIEAETGQEIRDFSGFHSYLDLRDENISLFEAAGELAAAS